MGAFLDLLLQSVVEIVVHLLDELVVRQGAQNRDLHPRPNRLQSFTPGLLMAIAGGEISSGPTLDVTAED